MGAVRPGYPGSPAGYITGKEVSLPSPPVLFPDAHHQKDVTISPPHAVMAGYLQELRRIGGWDSGRHPRDRVETRSAPARGCGPRRVLTLTTLFNHTYQSLVNRSPTWVFAHQPPLAFDPLKEQVQWVTGYWQTNRCTILRFSFYAYRIVTNGQ